MKTLIIILTLLTSNLAISKVEKKKITQLEAYKKSVEIDKATVNEYFNRTCSEWRKEMDPRMKFCIDKYPETYTIKQRKIIGQAALLKRSRLSCVNLITTSFSGFLNGLKLVGSGYKAVFGEKVEEFDENIARRELLICALISSDEYLTNKKTKSKTKKKRKSNPILNNIKKQK